jgi:crotonobetaine/carnitine-CoA ligase
MELTDTIVEQCADEPAVVSLRTLPALLAARVARNAEGPLFSDGTTVWSGADAIEIAARRAGTLAAHGIKRGDRVALLCGNRAEFMEVVLGCGWLGAVVVPINTASRGPQLEHILRNSGARLLVAEAHLVDVVHALDARDLPLEHIWLIDEPAANSLAPRYSTTPLPRATESIPAADVDEGDAFAVLYTSGTSGLSKGVICPHARCFIRTR